MRDHRLILAGSDRHAPIYCRVPGCGTPTSERKPFCAKHVLHSPYARAVALHEEQFPTPKTPGRRRNPA